MSSAFRRLVWLSAAAAICGANPVAAFAQSATGDIQGVVTEQAADALAGVSISVTNTGTGAFRVVTSGPDGRFAVPGLPAGTYDVIAMLDGFAAQRQERVTVRVGQTIESDLELRRAVLPETLTLAEAPSNLETRHSDISFRIDPVEVEHLPLAGRDPLSLLMLVPGVTSAVRGATPSAGGIDAASTAVVVDGLTEAGITAGAATSLRPPYRWSRLAIQEAQVALSGTVAEYGGSGPQGSLVTRSGSQIFSGRIFEEWRGGALTAATARGEELGLSGHQFGGAFGGPLAPGHVFFGVYDGMRSRDEHEVFLDLVDVHALPPAVQDRLLPLASNWQSTTDQDLLHVRTDHRIGPTGRVSLRYRQIDGHGGGTGGPQGARDTSIPVDLRSRSIAGTAAGRLGPLALNEVRASYVRESVDAGRPTGLAQADIHSNGALALRTGSHASDTRRTLRHVQLADTAMWSTFRHAFRAGGSIEWLEREHDVAGGAGGVYVFGSPVQFAAGVPSGSVGRYSQTFFANGSESLLIRPDSRQLALFVQDKWLVHDALSVDAGLRYERETWAAPGVTNPDAQLQASGIDTGTLHADSGTWSPRLGVAWGPSSRYIVRAAYSVTHGRIPEGLVSSAHVYNGIDARAITLSGADAAPSWPDRLGAPPVGARPGIVVFDREFEPSRFEHVSAGLEWAWMPSTAIGVTLLHVRGEHLPRAVELNVGAPFAAIFDTEEGALAAGRYAPGPFAGFDRVVRYESTAASRYTGLAMELRRRWGQGVIYRLAYTLGRTTDTGAIGSPAGLVSPPTARTVPAPAAPSIGFAPADHDRRHRLMATMLVRSDPIAGLLGSVVEPVLDNWRAAAVYTLEDGVPYSAMVLGDLNADSNIWNDLAPGTTRNEFRAPRTGRLDVRLSRDFSIGGVQLTGSFDVFNVMNSAHYRLVHDTLYALEGTALVRNPLFGERRDQIVPRTMQVGVAVGF